MLLPWWFLSSSNSPHTYTFLVHSLSKLCHMKWLKLTHPSCALVHLSHAKPVSLSCHLGCSCPKQSFGKSTLSCTQVVQPSALSLSTNHGDKSPWIHTSKAPLLVPYKVTRMVTTPSFTQSTMSNRPIYLWRHSMPDMAIHSLPSTKKVLHKSSSTSSHFTDGT
jgi:hypothetical protein